MSVRPRGVSTVYKVGGQTMASARNEAPKALRKMGVRRVWGGELKMAIFWWILEANFIASELSVFMHKPVSLDFGLENLLLCYCVSKKVGGAFAWLYPLAWNLGGHVPLVDTPLVRPQSFFNFNEIWHVGRGRWVMHDDVQYDPIQCLGVRLSVRLSCRHTHRDSPVGCMRRGKHRFRPNNKDGHTCFIRVEIQLCVYLIQS